MCAGPGSGQGQPPRMSYRLRDVLKSSYRAVPVRLYLGVMGRGLKCGGQRLHPLRQPLQRLGDRGIGRGFYRPAATLASLLQFIGEKERGIEKLTGFRSEEHTSELQSLMRISYAVFCLKQKQ